MAGFCLTLFAGVRVGEGWGRLGAVSAAPQNGKNRLNYLSPTYLPHSAAPGRDEPDFAHLVLSRVGGTGGPQEATGYWTRQS